MKRVRFIPLVVVFTSFPIPSSYATGYVVTIGTHLGQSNYPWGITFQSMRFQCLWLQPEIAHSGYINQVEFEKTNSLSASFYNVRVSLCYTTRTELGAIFDGNYTGYTPVQVLNASTLAFPPVSGYFDIGITPNKFFYDNSDNLLLEVRFNGHTGPSIPCYRSAQPYARIYEWDDNANQGIVMNDGQCIRLHIGTMAGVEPASFGKVKALFR